MTVWGLGRNKLNSLRLDPIWTQVGHFKPASGDKNILAQSLFKLSPINPI
jgi:hypothetical protein